MSLFTVAHIWGHLGGSLLEVSFQLLGGLMEVCHPSAPQPRCGV